MRHYVAVVRSQVPLVLLTTIVSAGVALATWFARSPTYEGRAEIVLQAQAPKVRSVSDPAPNQPQLSRLVPTELRVLTSQEVRAMAQTRLGYTPDVSARQIDQTDVMELTARAQTPERALRAARQYAAAYIEYRQAGATADLLASSREVENELTHLRERIDRADASGRAALEQLYGVFSDVEVQLRVDAASAVDESRLVSPITGETTPVKPGIVARGALGAGIGLVLGVDFALLFNLVDESVKTRTDLERSSGGLPVLGVIAEDRDLAAVAPGDRGFSADEAYLSVQTMLAATVRNRTIRLVQITSPGRGVGRTTTVANLGLALAAAGRHVVVVDADFQRPGLHDSFGLDNGSGLLSVMEGSVPLSAAVHDLPQQARLKVLGTGSVPRKVAELFSSSRLAGVLKTLLRTADIVLVDSPPLFAVDDPVVVSELFDATVLVVASGATRKRELSRSVELLHQVGAPVAGIVLNRAAGDLDPTEIQTASGVWERFGLR